MHLAEEARESSFSGLGRYTAAHESRTTGTASQIR